MAMTLPRSNTFPSSADFDAVLRADVQRGYQLASLIAPPAYIAFTLLRKRGLTLNRTLRATWLAGAGGAGAGAAYAYTEGMKGEPYLRDRHLLLAYDTSRIRNDDHATIGAVLLGVLTPAIFWKRARAVHLILGGAGLGSSLGIAAHTWRSFTETKVAPATPGPVVVPSDVPTQPPVERSGGGV